jgi:hypothetical protein
MKRAWGQIKRWSGVILGGAVAVLLTVLSLGWYVRFMDAQISELRVERDTAEAMTEIGRLQATRGEVTSQVGERDSRVAHLDRQIRVQKRVVVSAQHSADELDDDALEEAFKRALGG